MPDWPTYQEFLRSRKKDLCRILYAAKPKVELDEIINEGWIAASDIEERSGHPFDLDSLANQNYLIGRLYNKFVKFQEKNLYHAVSLNQDAEDNPTVGFIIHRLNRIFSAPDPL